jgi:prepilin-type processing-associated H-X9-DG protein
MKARELIFGLTVLLILGLVLALVLGQQQSNAREASALRNLQQWGIALNLYLIDNDNNLPFVGSMPVSADEAKAWFNALPPYLSRPALATLPPGERPRPGVDSFWVSPASAPVRSWDDEVFYFGYGMNRYLQPDPDLRSFRIHELERPGQVIFMSEKAGYDSTLTPENILSPWGSGMHPEAMVLFCDGHVRKTPRPILVDDPQTLSVQNLETEDGITWFKE